MQRMDFLCHKRREGGRLGLRRPYHSFAFLAAPGWHCLPLAESFCGVYRHCSDILREQDAALLRSPGEDFSIMDFQKVNILDRENIQGRRLRLKTTNDLMVEVFVDGILPTLSPPRPSIEVCAAMPDFRRVRGKRHPRVLHGSTE
jgi:hypothetical protein